MAESGFDAESLILKIGETSLMYDVDATITRLEALKGLGVHLAVDDFGTWYSSLSFLQRFPIDILKIDRSFVSGIGDTEEVSALVHTLVQLGIALGLRRSPKASRIVSSADCSSPRTSTPDRASSSLSHSTWAPSINS